MKTGEKSNRQAGTAGRVGRWFTVLVCIILFVSCGTAYANAPSDSQTVPVVIDPVSSESVDSRTPTGGETKLTVSGSKYVAKGKTVTLIASADVTWKTGDKKIATVSAKGVVKGIKAGKVKITAVSKANPKLKKVWTMTVTAKAASKVTITAPATELSLSEKKTVTLKAAANPAQAAQSFEWQSSDSAVARVDQKGKVTAVSTGKATITATATDGSKKKAKVTITVKGSEDPKPKDQISVLVITLNPEESWYREKNVQDLRDTFTEANGYNATFVTAPWPGDQMDTFQSYIGQVDYILLCAADTNGWDELFARAKESGTGVFLYDRTVDCDPDLYLAAVISSYRKDAETAVAWLKKQQLSEYRILHVQGGPGSTAQLERTAALEAAVKANSNWTIVAQGSAGYAWDPAVAGDLARKTINAGKTFNVVYAENDGIANGVAEVLDEMGITHGPGGDVIIIGFDCNKWALRKLKNGEWNYDVQCSPFQAGPIDKMIRQLESGKPITGLDARNQYFVLGKGFDAATITEKDIRKYGLGEE